jgi:hypothetical protein
MRVYPSVGLQVADILLPGRSIDMPKWAVIACDQYTSQPEYWQKVKEIVGNAPSTLNLIFPEVYLGKNDEEAHIHAINQSMASFLDQGLFDSFEGLVAVERQVGASVRKGIMLALDLEKYDFNRGSQSLIRATEGTILDRLPPRIKIRKNAPLELPHILVLVDDPQKTVIEPVWDSVQNTRPLYDFDLMLGSGHIKGWKVTDADVEKNMVAALEKLSDRGRSRKSTGWVGKKRTALRCWRRKSSLATAKSVWEMNKGRLGMDHPSRYALVELENLHDPSLVFEPIHRVLTGTIQKPSLPDAFVLWSTSQN